MEDEWLAEREMLMGSWERDSCALEDEQEEQREGMCVDAGVGFEGRAEEG